jgi:eukaryotic-like serine/threonine-protein kinase
VVGRVSVSLRLCVWWPRPRNGVRAAIIDAVHDQRLGLIPATSSGAHRVNGSPSGELRAALADRYRFERELGRGGMATVYLVHDLRHERPVALKVLHPDRAESFGSQRFQREILVAARLQHPHILSVLDSGELPGTALRPAMLWFTMPFVDGETLRQRLEREKRLRVEDAVRIACEAADALEYAHGQGVIHRDIKPENILLSAGHALVADFGIARAVRSGLEDRRLTETGTTVGTPTYMSPEQAIGEEALDARTDQYSLACVLWEMLLGEPPFAGATAQAMLARRFSETPNALQGMRDTVPEAVAHTVMKALSRSPADRFDSTADFARALRDSIAQGSALKTTRFVRQAPGTRRRLLFPVVLAVGAMLAAWLGWHRFHPGATAGVAAGGPKRLAVLPFENLGRPEDTYFADGITDEIRGKLAGLPGLQVTASSSSNQYRSTGKTPQEIGRELGVEYLLTGRVRWERSAEGQSRVRVSPELIQVKTASTRWQQPFEAALTDVFQVQADVASRVASAMDIALGEHEQAALAGKPTASLPAYDLYLQGNQAANGFDQVVPAEVRRAIGLYERAVALDSTFALAWAQLSRAHSHLYQISLPTKADDVQAKAAADRALALSPNLAQGRLALGDYYRMIRDDAGAALNEYRLGRLLAPNDADLLKGIGLVGRSQGDWNLSQMSLAQAQVLDPRSIAVERRLTYNLLRLRRYAEALASADRAMALNPHAPDVYETKAMVYLGMGDLPAARRVIEEAQHEVEPTALVQWVATYYDLFWVLNDEQQRLLLRLPPGPFDGDRQTWGLALAATFALRGDSARAAAYGDSASSAGEAYIREAPDNAQLHVLQGTALAYAGRKTAAVREGELALRLTPMTRDAYRAPYIQHQLARIYLLVGEPERAIAALEPLLRMPYILSPGWLKVDPMFDPLRANPRFQKLIEGTAAEAEER